MQDYQNLTELLIHFKSIQRFNSYTTEMLIQLCIEELFRMKLFFHRQKHISTFWPLLPIGEVAMARMLKLNLSKRTEIETPRKGSK